MDGGFKQEDPFKWLKDRMQREKQQAYQEQKIIIEQNDRIQIPRKNIILFILTIITTYLVQGVWYSFSIITILLAHELGHYFACRAYRVPATVPFFIPMPLPPFGTMGAVIKMKGIIPNRKALFDIGVAGPIAGLVFAIPAIIIGLKFSTVITGAAPKSMISLGESILFKGLSYMVLGPLPENSDVLLHPVAYAGWAGLFVTALNLLPIGQLDGGHIVYSIFGKASKKIFDLGILALAAIAIFVNPGWILLLVLVFFFARKHPPTLDDSYPIDQKRIVIGIVMIVIFFLSFTPTPIYMNTP